MEGEYGDIYHIIDIMIKKNEVYCTEIIDQGIDGEGIAKVNNMTIFISGAIKGEIVEILIVKVLSSFAYGKLLRVIKGSKNREKVDCSSYQKCGGCSLRHMKYKVTLSLKKDIVENCFYKILHREVKIEDCIGMDQPIGYRNKLIFPLGKNKEGKNTIGVYAKRSHTIIETDRCYLQNKKNEEIARFIFNFFQRENIPAYDEKNRNGIVRHIIIRNGYKTGDVMIILVTKDEKLIKENDLVNEVIVHYPEVKTIVKNVNKDNTNVILGKENIILYGNGYIYDKLGEFQFKISPFSFYQVNPIQTELLYNKAIEFAKLDKDDILCDLYCGIGTIGIFASNKVKKVYGIEIVEEAVGAAKENAKINNVNNIEFMVGDVEKAFKVLIDEKKIIPNAVIVDPPRRGLDNTTINKLNELELKKLVYISCNPATMVRDLKMLEEKYDIKEIQPIDMFPYTSHVECCALLEIKKDL